MNKYQKYNSSPKGKQRKKDYLKQTGKYTSSKKYQAKDFIAIGGLAERLDDGNSIYSHLALSTGASITNEAGLSTNQILDFIVSNTKNQSDAILVSYSGTFDWNNWLVDLTREQLEYLYTSNYKTKSLTVGMYKLRLARGQSFTITDLWNEKRTINEVFGFFQQPLEQTVKEYLGYSINGGNKYSKSTFTGTLDNAKEQLQLELRALVDVMIEFRARLDKVNLRPRRWSGAGSITSNLFSRHNIKDFMEKQPEDIAKYARIAYAGGRFEMVRYGSVKKNLSYAYDINSAYPEAMLKLPVLAGGRWHHIAGDPGNSEFALYKISIRAKKFSVAHPLFARDSKGVIFYPPVVTGWYWSPEIAAVRDWAEKGYGEYEIDQAFIFEPATTLKPFYFLYELYQKRLELQKNNDPAEVGLKLVLNTAYGKLAQQTGWIENEETGEPETTPPYHQLEYAGFITSYTRAKIYKAALEDLPAVIAFETDALYTSSELNEIPIDDRLGSWKETIYSELTYINSGVYFGKHKTGKSVFKLRGLLPGSLTVEEIDKTLNEVEPFRKITVKQMRFISALVALQTKTLDNWLLWVPEAIEIKLYPIGKRVHALCQCQDYESKPLTREYWHTTMTSKKFREMVEYCVEWINPDAEQMAMRNKQKLDSESLL